MSKEEASEEVLEETRSCLDTDKLIISIKQVILKDFVGGRESIAALSYLLGDFLGFISSDDTEEQLNETLKSLFDYIGQEAFEIREYILSEKKEGEDGI